MPYKCYDCGHVFEPCEAGEYEDYGEFWGVPFSEKYPCCPKCGGGYGDAFRCKICENDYLEDELYGGVCEDCIDGYKYDFKTCFEIGKNDNVEIELNGFLAAAFSSEDIERILMRSLEEESKVRPINCTPWISENKDWFGKMLLEKYKKEERNYSRK